MSSDEEDVEPSVLGTKEHWDEQYATELETFQDCGDVGEIWFGRRVLDTMVRWIDGRCADHRDATAVLDLGCGNGVLLLELAKKGFRRLAGVDYAESAIELARTIAAARQVVIDYQTLDLLAEPAPASARRYDVVTDKGTFDAVALARDFGPAARDRYAATVAHLLRDDGVFLVCTCNWTREEIAQHMQSQFVVTEELETPTMQFGGRQGRTVAIVAFRKK